MDSKLIFYEKSSITLRERERINGHKGAIIWITGFSMAGKSTIAKELEKTLFGMNIHTYCLDGDNIRTGLNSDLDFSPEDRNENIRRIGEVSLLFQNAGFIVIVAFISPYRKGRDFVRNKAENGRFIEIHLNCPLEICENRDRKGLYKKARSGALKNFTGISAAYEEPLHPELKLDTEKLSPSECVSEILSTLKANDILPSSIDSETD